MFIERLWRSLKYECVYLHAYEMGSELRAGVAAWVGLYNTQRPYSALAGRTLDEAYGSARPLTCPNERGHISQREPQGDLDRDLSGGDVIARTGLL